MDADRAARHPCDCILDYPGFPTDKRDYYSLARYYHPNPDTPNGLPYVSRDGVFNPESVRGPKSAIGRLAADALCLGMAGLFIDTEYARIAMHRLHRWFIDDSSAMNANLNHAQAKLGINDGSACGTIDSHTWINLVLGLELLERALGTSEFFDGMRNWFGRYADWLYTSELGRGARDIGNNISAWWAAQIMIYAGYSAKGTPGVNDCTALYRDFIDTRMDERGCFVGELCRTRSLHYNLFCLTAMVLIAASGDGALWHYRGPHG